MQEGQFSIFYNKTIESIVSEIESQDNDAVIELDILGDILSIITPSGEYIINKQPALNELWLASPVSGPYHFILQDGKWISRSGDDFLNILSSELSVFVPILLENL